MKTYRHYQSKINVQSAGVSQEEQIFYTNDDDETEEQFWARKEAIRKNPATDEPTVTIQTLSTNLVKQHPDIQVRLRKNEPDHYRAIQRCGTTTIESKTAS